MSGQHFLIVTADPTDSADPDLYDFQIECPGVTDSCRRYEDCVPNGPEQTLLEAAVDDDGEPFAHGAKHLMIGGVWCAATDRCNVQGHDGLGDAVAGRFGPGRHAVDYDFGDGTELDVFAADPESVTTAPYAPDAKPCSYPGCGKPTAYLPHANNGQGNGWGEGWRHVDPADEVDSHVGYPMSRDVPTPDSGS